METKKVYMVYWKPTVFETFEKAEKYINAVVDGGAVESDFLIEEEVVF